MNFSFIEKGTSSIEESDMFQTYSLLPKEPSSHDLDSQHVLIYGVNPGPTKSIIPLADEFLERGAQVSFKLGEPALSNVLEYFDKRIVYAPHISSGVTMAFTCGHINVDNVTNDMVRLKYANPDLRIITMDDNFDGTLPIIERLLSLGFPPHISFIMNPNSKLSLEQLFLGHDATESRVVVTNNPAFERFYETENSNARLKQDFRRQLEIPQQQRLVTFIGFPEGDYPPDYHDFVFESVALAMEQIQNDYSFIYWPHGRGKDRLPKQFKGLSNADQIIFHKRAWWSKAQIGIHKQLIGADIALMTNSTASAEVFTAWGKGMLPMSVPLDISLVHDFPHLRLNTTLRDKELVEYMESREKLIAMLAQAVLAPFDWSPRDAKNRLHHLGWDSSPLNVIVDEISRI